MKKVLILCTGNSCRSIMAEALINAKLANIKAESAGIHASKNVNQNAKIILKEADIWRDIYHSKSIDAMIHNHYDLIVTVCKNAKDTCPVFPKKIKSIHIGFEDPDGKNIEIFRNTFMEIRDRLLPKIKKELS